MATVHEQFIVDKNGKKTAVVIPIREYETVAKGANLLFFSKKSYKT